MKDFGETYVSSGPAGAMFDARPERQVGMQAGTLVAAETGWCRIGDVQPGCKVWTFDNGLQPVLSNERANSGQNAASMPPTAEVIHIPEGTLANEQALVLSPDTGLLLECENGCDAMGDPFAVVPVSALEGVCKITRTAPPDGSRLHRLVFAQEQAIYIDSGLMVHCPTDQDARGGSTAGYDVKSAKAAQAFLTDLDLAELVLREANEDFFGAKTPDQVA